MEMMFLPLKRYADFMGRSRRREYWLWFLFQVILALVFGIIRKAAGDQNAQAVQAVNSLVNLGLLIPTIAVSVRRFHDINRTGWWYVFPLVVFLVSLVLFLVLSSANLMTIFQQISQAGQHPTPDQSMAILQSLAPLGWVFFAWWLASLVTFVFHVMDGTAGPNRFGPDPKGRGGNINVF